MLKKKNLSFKNRKDNKKEDITWVLDGIVGFLQSPTWTVPIMNFVEDNCSCFEIKEENKFEYTDIHLKYKSLVEELLFKYITELNISEDLFADACNKHKGALKKVQGVFEYVWAADEFLLFKRIMARHNVELDMQAISMVQIHNASGNNSVLETPFPSAVSSTSHPRPYTFVDEPDHKTKVDFLLNKSKKEFATASSRLRKLEEQDEMNLQRAIEFSKQETARLNKLVQLEKEMIEKAILLSLENMNRKGSGRDAQQTNQSHNLSSQQTSSSQQASSSSTQGSFEQTLSSEKPLQTKIILEIDQTLPTKQILPPEKAILTEKTLPTEKALPTGKALPTEQALPTKKGLKSSSSAKKSKTTLKSEGANKTLAPLKKRNASDIANDWLQEAKEEAAVSSSQVHSPLAEDKKSASSNNSYVSQPNAIDPEKLAERKKYLQEQREKILEAKRQQRNEELMKHEKETSSGLIYLLHHFHTRSI